MPNLQLSKLIPEHIRSFEPYYPSLPDQELMQMHGLDHLHRLNNNENVLGPPPAVRDLLDNFHSSTIPIYPNGDSRQLRQALGEKFGKTPEQFLVGNGSCELISSVIKAFCESGDNIVTADKTFAVYEWTAKYSGLDARLVPLNDFAFDPEAILAAIDEHTKVVFICNPNNPTGTYWDKQTMRRFLDAVGGERIVVVDEAYCEYVEKEDFPDAIQLQAEYPNVVVFRTFSKMYALAALRVGYLYASEELVDFIRRAHVVYSVNTLAQLAAAAAVQSDAAFLAATRAMVGHGKRMLGELFTDMGFQYLAGEGNFMMVKTPMSDTLLHRKMMREGILIRTMTGFRFPNWIRISMSHAPIMEEFCATFRTLFHKA